MDWFFETLLELSTRFRVARGGEGPTAAFISRDGSVKYFDFDRNVVLTLMPDRVAGKIRVAKTLTLFDHFETPDFTLWKVEELFGGGSLDHGRGNGRPETGHRRNRDLNWARTEALHSIPCMGMLPHAVQRLALREICRRYASYARAESGPPLPDLFMPCFDEVGRELHPSQQARFYAKAPAFEDFVSSARTVRAHLDFNVGNFLRGHDRLWLLDIADAGLRLPATFDVNNLLLNEVYERRSLDLLRYALGMQAESGINDVLSTTIATSTREALGTSLFVNFVLRQSAYVSEHLFGVTRSRHVSGHWSLFEKSIPGWPSP